jgi:hypothetical protein
MSYKVIAIFKVMLGKVEEEMNFNPQEMFVTLGIRADLANYRKRDF